MGCGTGDFARRLARRAERVDACDVSAETIGTAATQLPASTVRYVRADIMDPTLELGQYDAITCVASIHHMPFAPAVDKLRARLVPGGVLLILGCYREQSSSDRLLSLLAVPANILMGAGHRAMRTANHRSTLGHRPPVADPAMTLADIHAEVGRLLPGARIRRHLLWRYSLRFQQPASGQG